MDLRVDVSQTDFSQHLIFDESIFHEGDAEAVRNTVEYYEDPAALIVKMWEFSLSNEERLYVTTNYGDWRRPSLPAETKSEVRKFLNFRPHVRERNDTWLKLTEFEVLSVRCGDAYFLDPEKRLTRTRERELLDIVQNHVLGSGLPVVVMSDSLWAKESLGKRFGFLDVPTVPSHGANGNVLPVMMDMELLTRSKRNSHISMAHDWWSGFSHFTSLAFDVPEFNAVAPPRTPEPFLGQIRSRLKLGTRIRRLLN